MTAATLPCLQIGTHTILALTDGVGPFFAPRVEAFPDATPEQWAAADRFDPGSVEPDGGWRLQFRAFAILGDKGVTIVDAGIGPADGPAASWAPVPGALPDQLEAADIDRADVHNVVITHLHTDHVGWAVTGADAEPFFPNAEYLLQRAEVDAIEHINPQLGDALVEPLRRAARLRLLDGDVPLPTGERVVATPGHTPGHQSVLVAAGRDLAAVTGDLLVHAIQLLYSDLGYAYEMDAETARRSREQVFGVDAATRLHLATPHLTEPFVTR
ncbi:MAG TPA: MBL fold metallo-hydrolase [Glycomyces sp.]|nr:MBL fold metallo-hydrolase [Glycomyces sp.]